MRKRADVIREFNESWDDHHGHVAVAAPLMGMSVSALDRALFRAKAAGVEIKFTAYTRPGTHRKRTSITEMTDIPEVAVS